MHEGALWWFDNDQMHKAENDGTEDRVHIIFDLLPAHMREAVIAAREAAQERMGVAA